MITLILNLWRGDENNNIMSIVSIISDNIIINYYYYVYNQYNVRMILMRKKYTYFTLYSSSRSWESSAHWLTWRKSPSVTQSSSPECSSEIGSAWSAAPASGRGCAGRPRQPNDDSADIGWALGHGEVCSGPVENGGPLAASCIPIQWENIIIVWCTTINIFQTIIFLIIVHASEWPIGSQYLLQL